jgi:hypothetical protein
MNFFDHKDLGNHLLQLCPKVVKHPVFVITCIQHAKPPLRITYSQNPNPIFDTSASYDDINGSTAYL